MCFPTEELWKQDAGYAIYTLYGLKKNHYVMGVIQLVILKNYFIYFPIQTEKK